MNEYLFFKLERFRPEGGNHINNQVKYWCEITFQDGTKQKIGDIEIEGVLAAPLTDDNPYRLIGQIAKLYQSGDIIKTIPEAKITDSFGPEVELREPLSHDELRILSLQVLDALDSKSKIRE
ncbi:MAG: hypothetical protein ACP5N1_03280 [Candidatus Woesearchaeota archaeon]